MLMSYDLANLDESRCCVLNSLKWCNSGSRETGVFAGLPASTIAIGYS